jgi:hypothetical protein
VLRFEMKKANRYMISCYLKCSMENVISEMHVEFLIIFDNKGISRSSVGSALGLQVERWILYMGRDIPSFTLMAAQPSIASTVQHHILDSTFHHLSIQLSCKACLYHNCPPFIVESPMLLQYHPRWGIMCGLCNYRLM